MRPFLKALAAAVLLALIWWGITRDTYVPLMTMTLVPALFSSSRMSDRDRILGAMFASLFFAVGGLYMFPKR